MDPITSIGAGLAVLASKDILVKILGPTADYVGEEMKGLIEKCNINLGQIFIKAKNKLGDRLEIDGAVSPRVLKSVLDEGRYCEDELTAEYYGGVLASSKTRNGRDDRGVSYMEIIKCLSVYQLRFHYLFYFLFKQSGEENTNIETQIECERNTMFIPFNVFTHAMEFSESENESVILTHTMAGLATNGLLGTNYCYGAHSHVTNAYKDCPEEGGIILEPTVLGAELFLWAEGVNSIEGSKFLTSEFKLPKPIVPINEGSTIILKS